MNFSKISKQTVVLAAFLVATACGTDTATGPSITPAPVANAGLLGTLVSTLKTVKGVTWKSGSMPSYTKAQLLNNRLGGVIELPTQGLRITVPAGALPRDTMTITVNVIGGRLVAYDFAPHGTTFLKGLTFSQDLSKTNVLLAGVAFIAKGGYFASNSQLDQTNGTASVNELFDARIVLLNNRVEFTVPHFSGYMVSSF